MEDDSYVRGLERSSVSFSGTWNPSDQWPFENVREVKLTVESRKLFGIDWWAERHSFSAAMETAYAIEGPEAVISCDIKPLSPTTVERSEWWRRAGFRIVRRLPTRKKGWR